MKKNFFAILISGLFIFSATACSEDEMRSMSSRWEEQKSAIASGNNIVDSITLKLSDTRRCANCSIKLASGYSPSATYSITPNGFDMEELQKKGYYMKITVSYKVRYQKDWGLGIGYFGAPKYEISIFRDDLRGWMDSDLTTTTEQVSRTFSKTTTIADLRNTTLSLTFSTDNIQNIIYFSDIVVQYQCLKW